MRTLIARIAMNEATVPEATVPSLSALSGYMRMMWPGTPALEEKSGGLAGTLALMGDVEVALAPAPITIPWHEIESACERSWMWPEAVDAMKAHTQHLVVTAKVADGGGLKPALALTRLVSAVLDNVEAIGVHFGAAGMVTSAKQFDELSRDMSEEALPLYLWLGFHAYKEEDGTSTVYTTGMEVFDSPEIEVVRSDRPLEQLQDVLYTIVHHVIGNGVTLSDGDSIDLGDGLVVRVSRGPARFHEDREAIQLTV